MPAISRITVQKKRKQRYNIFILNEGKEEYSFSVEEETMISEGLVKGKELTELEMQYLKSKDEVNKAYNQALNYLGYRMRATKEIRTYLKEKEIDEEQIDFIVDKLTKDKLLDDQAFSEAYVRTKKNTLLKGPNSIKQELRQKGIDQEIIEEALNHFSEDEQVEKLTVWLEKQANKSTNQSKRQHEQKLIQQLMQKGFKQGTILQALSDITIESSEDEEWDSCVYQGDKILNRKAKKYKGYQLKQHVKAGLYQKGFDQSLINRYLDEVMD